MSFLSPDQLALLEEDVPPPVDPAQGYVPGSTFNPPPAATAPVGSPTPYAAPADPSLVSNQSLTERLATDPNSREPVPEPASWGYEPGQYQRHLPAGETRVHPVQGPLSSAGLESFTQEQAIRAEPPTSPPPPPWRYEPGVYQRRAPAGEVTIHPQPGPLSGAGVDAFSREQAIVAEPPETPPWYEPGLYQRRAVAGTVAAPATPALTPSPAAASPVPSPPPVVPGLAPPATSPTVGGGGAPIAGWQPATSPPPSGGTSGGGGLVTVANPFTADDFAGDLGGDLGNVSPALARQIARSANARLTRRRRSKRGFPFSLSATEFRHLVVDAIGEALAESGVALPGAWKPHASGTATGGKRK